MGGSAGSYQGYDLGSAGTSTMEINALVDRHRRVAGRKTYGGPAWKPFIIRSRGGVEETAANWCANYLADKWKTTGSTDQSRRDVYRCMLQ